MDQAQTGAELGAAGNVAGRVVGRAFSPSVNPKSQLLQSEGVYVTPGQTGGSFAKSAEEKMTSMPLVGDAIKSSYGEGLDSFNRALYRRTLAPLGPDAAAYGSKLPVGNEGVAKVGDYLSNAYENVLSKSVPSALDNQFTSGLSGLASIVPQSRRGDFVDSMTRIISPKITPSGTLTPSAAKAADSELGQLYRSYKGSNDGDQRLLAQAYLEARSQLRQLVARNNPEQAPILRAVDNGWANLTQLETAAGRVGAKEGVVTPAQYLSAVKGSDASIRDRAFARGMVPNQQFAQAADSVLSRKYPDSGTAGRTLFNLGALGLGGGGLMSGMLSPGTAAMGAATAIPYLPGVRNLFTSRPQSLLDLGSGLRDISPYLSIPAMGLAGPSP
jgi:hypothetical protein